MGVGAVSRLFAVLRCLGDCDEGGERVTQLAQRVGLSQPTTHRLLRSLMDEGMVEQDLLSKRYRLSIEFFALAAKAGNTRQSARRGTPKSVTPVCIAGRLAVSAGTQWL
ncbi:IclR family transcriptional regulator [Pseudomonas syringae pv. maculicola]|nr:IclR family transcriptional regulator [Pseudomonas syringae pv. maculicola]